MNTRSLLALAGVVALTACGGDDKDPTGPGGKPVTSYQATFKGGVARSVSGQAAFASDNSQDGIGFALALSDTENEASADLIMFHRAQAGVPGSGTITLADYASADSDAELPATAMVATAFLDGAGDTILFCASSGGSLNIQSSSSTRLKGTFTMTMVCASLTSEEEIQTEVTGSFDAAGGVVTIPD